MEELARQNKKRRRRPLKSVKKLNQIIKQENENAKNSNLLTNKHNKYKHTIYQDLTNQKRISNGEVDGEKCLYIFKEDLRTESLGHCGWKDMLEVEDYAETTLNILDNFSCNPKMTSSNPKVQEVLMSKTSI